VLVKNIHHVRSINKNLARGSLLCHDSYKIVFESKKFVRSGTSIGKYYECEGLFHLSFSEVFDKAINHIYTNIDTNV
jgi:hypothetical protein